MAPGPPANRQCLHTLLRLRVLKLTDQFAIRLARELLP